MEGVTSGDGTRIAFERSGAGPALLIVGGSLADHRFYAPLADALADNFTVYNFDRRGRGESGDTEPYAVDREVEDVGALIAQAGESVLVYGHSAGAALALRAAAAGLNVARLALADPPYAPRGEDDEAARAEHAEQAARIQELNGRGDYEGSVKYFLKDFGLSDEDLEAMLRSPAGEGMLDCARALPHDYAVLGDGLVPTELAARTDVPTTVLAAWSMPETARVLADAMPDARFRAMDASAHELPPEVMAPILEGVFSKP